MKARELMIGDWVFVHEPECKGHQVDLIDLTNEQVGCDGEIYGFDDIRPIPLTPEILKRIGFKKDKGGEESWYSKAGWMVPSKYNRKADPISWEVEIIGKYNFDGVIKYVHQLQHALQLCGIRKQINL